MLKLPGFKIKTQLYESNHSYVYRGTWLKNQDSVILKVMKESYPTPERVAWFKREVNLTGSTKSDRVVGLLGYETHGNRWLMILEDFGGESLDRLDVATTMALPDIVTLMMHTAEALGDVHAEGVIHRDINPANIVYNPETGALKLIDFGVSSDLASETTAFCNPNELEGTLAYISPEQTGRMNREADYRTDLYSLGATYYHLLCGRPPFEEEDPLALLHCHLAKTPEPPADVNPSIPRVLSDISMKLMAKNVEDRYQSTAGLVADLRRCYEGLNESGFIEPFPLGQYDNPSELRFPRKLYGRDRERDQLLDVFKEVVSSGYPRVFMVDGFSGIGKSVLIREIYRPVTAHGGYFLEGKFDQIQRDIPYLPIIQALTVLIRDLLSDGSHKLRHWRESIQAALSPNGAVLTNLIPELELIIGKQPELPDLPPKEEANRFKLVFQKFTRLFTRNETSLIFFLDDLQWADESSLDLLASLVTPESGSLMVLGAYRGNEIGPAHPLHDFRAKVFGHHVLLDTIELGPLGSESVRELLADALSRNDEDVSELAELVTSKTGGNPFFVHEFLNLLVKSGVLVYVASGLQAGWDWEMPRIHAMDISDNLADLLTRKIGKLPAGTRDILEVAAAMAGTFSLNRLAGVMGQNTAEAAAALKPAVDSELISPVTSNYKLTATGVDGLEKSVRTLFKFNHDRIQGAVYEGISDDDLPVLSLRIGRYLLDSAPDQVFDIVNQYNQALPLLTSVEEKHAVAELNLAAGQKATASAAYHLAHEYLTAGLSILSERAWQEDYDFTLAFHIASTEAAYLSGNDHEMNTLAETVFAQARTALDKVVIYEIRMMAYESRLEAEKAYAEGMAVLELLDVNFPKEVGFPEVGAAIEEIVAITSELDLENFLDSTALEDPVQGARLRILSSLLGPVLNVAPMMYPLLVCRQARILSDHFQAPETIYVLANYGVILCNFLGNYESGYRMGKTAIDRLDTCEDKRLAARAFLVHLALVMHWKHHLRDLVQPYRECLQIATDAGDFEYAGLAAMGYCAVQFYMGRELPELEKEYKEYDLLLAEFEQSLARYWHQIFKQTINNLMDRSEHPTTLSDNILQLSKKELEEMNRQNTSTRFYMHYHGMMLHYFFEEYQAAFADAVVMHEEMEAAYGGGWFGPPMVFHVALAYLAVHAETEASQRDALLEVAAGKLEKMKTWPSQGVTVYEHMTALVEAEYLRVTGVVEGVGHHYDRAIALSQEFGYRNIEALSFELAARFYMSIGRERMASYYLRDAHYAYRRWGAIAKVRDLEKKHASLLIMSGTDMLSSVNQSIMTTSRQSGATIDLDSVVRASQAISGEIFFDKLIRQLMRVLIENAGARFGVLALGDSLDLKVEAMATFDDEVKTSRVSLPLDDCKDLPKKIVNYVLKTRESIVLDNAANSRFHDDPYIMDKEPKSVLCMPILHQARLRGFLYLQNDLNEGTFTGDRLEVLNLLSGQIAISIENASLYAGLEQKVEERTKELNQRNRELETLDKIVRRVNRKVGFKDLLLTLLRQGINLFAKAEKGSVFYWDHHFEHYQFMAAHGYDSESLSRLTLSESFVDAWFSHARGESVCVVPANAPALPGFVKPKSTIAANIATGDRRFALIVLDSFSDETEFESADADKLVRFREHAVSALNKADLMRELAYRNEEMVSSIRYAKRIQEAIFPNNEALEDVVPEAFVLFLPRDLVSGDFYWCTRVGDQRLVVVADCTGHGVPGAFLSLIGHTLLNKIVIEQGLTSPAAILGELHLEVRGALRQDQEGMSLDGMDVGICLLVDGSRKVTFAGAKRPLFITRGVGEGWEVETIRGDRKSIGGHQKERRRAFRNHEVIVNPGETLFLSSDGYSDQQGPDDKKYGISRMRALYQRMAPLGIKEQAEILNNELQGFMEDEPQRDDITVLGFRLD